MKIDVNMLLQLEYLNEMVLQINGEIDILRNDIVKPYNLDKIIVMDLNDVKTLFEQYNVICDNTLKLLNSNFLDESWEYADLYSDDIAYSLEKKARLSEEAKNEIEHLNKKIYFVNEEINKKINKLENNLEFFEEIIRILNSECMILNEDLEKLKVLIINSDLIDSDKVVFSYNIVKYLIESDRKILAKNKVFNTSEFEQLLAQIYNGISSDLGISIDDKDVLYSNLILDYFKRYSELFVSLKINGHLDEIMNTCINLSVGVDDLTDSLLKENFCIEVAGLLYQLYYMGDKDSVATDVLMKLSKLDKLYDENFMLEEQKEELLNKIIDDLDYFNKLDVDIVLKNKIINRLNLLLIELKNNVINVDRKAVIDNEYKQIKNDIAEQIGRMMSYGESKDDVY